MSRERTDYPPKYVEANQVQSVHFKTITAPGLAEAIGLFFYFF